MCSASHIIMYFVQMSYKDLRTKHEPDVANLYGFSSAKKMASVLVRTDNGFRLYNKVTCCPVPALRLLPCCLYVAVQRAHQTWHPQVSSAPWPQGAAEIVLNNATRVLNNEGIAVPLGADQRAELEATITQVRRRLDASFRLICCRVSLCGQSLLSWYGCTTVKQQPQAVCKLTC
jgi:hypothetical protein